MRILWGRPSPVGADVSTFLTLFVHFIANAQIQDFTRKRKKKKYHWEITHKLKSPLKYSVPSNKRNRCHLSFYFFGTRKMPTPKSYEHYQHAQFLWGTFQLGFKIWNSGFSSTTTSLTYVQNNPQLNVDEVSNSEARNLTGLNKNNKVINTLWENLLHFLSFPIVVYDFLPPTYIV